MPLNAEPMLAGSRRAIMRAVAKRLGDREHLLVFAALAIVVARLVVRVVADRHLQMDMDEAVHARDGQEYAYALSRLDGSALGGLLSRPQWYPPAHGMLLGLWFVAFGSSVLTARLYSVLCFGCLLLAVHWCTRLVCTSRTPRFAYLSLVALACDPHQLALGATAMLETPSALWATLAIALHLRATQAGGRQALGWYAAATAAALVTFFSRYVHGVAVLATLSVAHAVSAALAIRTGTRRAWVPALVFGLASALALAGWFFALGQAKWFLQYSTAQPATVARWSLANVVYYPRVLFGTLPFGPIALGVFGAALLFPRSRKTTGPQALLLVYAAVAYALLFLVRQKDARFGTLLAVPVWILAASKLDSLVEERLRGTWRHVLAFALGGAVAADIGGNWSRAFPAVYEGIGKGVDDAYRAIAAVARPWERSRTTAVLFGRSDARSGHALEFALASSCEAQGRRCDVSVLDEAELKKGWPRGRWSSAGYDGRLRRALDEADFVVAYGKAPPSRVTTRVELFERSFRFRAGSGGGGARVPVWVFGKGAATARDVRTEDERPRGGARP
jgi:hypothetical protein